MTTWWEERAARIDQAVRMVRAQTSCTRSEALATLRRRAEETDSDLDEAATAVVSMGTRRPDRD